MQATARTMTATADLEKHCKLAHRKSHSAAGASELPDRQAQADEMIIPPQDPRRQAQEQLARQRRRRRHRHRHKSRRLARQLAALALLGLLASWPPLVSCSGLGNEPVPTHLHPHHHHSSSVSSPAPAPASAPSSTSAADSSTSNSALNDKATEPTPSALEAFAPLVSPPGGGEHHYLASRQLPQAALLTSNPLVRTVNPGDRVNIPCSLANMGGSIQFAKDDQPIILDSGCAHCQLDISNDGQASLTINRVSAKDQGNWQCWRLDSSGKIKQKIPIIQLVITNSPELPILIVNDKELLGGNNLDATITVKENEMVNFRCVIKGASTPVDYVHWMLDSAQNVTHLSQLMMEYSPQDNNYLTQSVLRLNATKSMNLKSISCLSNHQLWLTPMTVTAFLNVLYEPSFTISREPGFGIPVSEGMTVILKCEIDSNPSSSPIWIKDADSNKTQGASATGNSVISSANSGQGAKEAAGEPIVLDTQDDGSVIFQPAQRADSGWYRCKTENKNGNFSSFGYYLNVRPGAASSASSPASQPAAPSAPQMQPSRQVSRPAELAGQAPYAPARVMAPNQPAAQTGRLGAASLASSNMVNNDQPAAVANYPVAFNAPDTGCKAGRVDGHPEIEHPVSTVSAVLGRQLILPLRFCCNPGPARVFWIHRHLAMIPGRMFGPYITRDIYTAYNSFYCYESTFEIEAVKPEDIGTVYVFVSNEKGHAGAQIHIQLSRQPQQQQVTEQSSAGSSSRFPLAGSSAASILNNQIPRLDGRTWALAAAGTNLHQLIRLMILTILVPLLAATVAQQHYNVASRSFENR